MYIVCTLTCSRCLVLQEPAALCVITASAHSVPGGQLGVHPGPCGNDRISTVPLERWDVELPPSDNPAGGQPCCCTSAASQGRKFSTPPSCKRMAKCPPAPAELNSRYGAFLAGADLFDAPALGVSPAEALLMDPQQRLAMQSFSGEPARQCWLPRSRKACFPAPP